MSKYFDVDYANYLRKCKKDKELYKYANSFAKKKNADAIAYYGICFNYGINVKVNIAKAIDLYQESTNMGSGYGMYFLGELYLQGTQVDKNDYRAFELYTSSAATGCKFGQFALGKCFESGIATEKDLCQAIFWFTKSAEQNYDIAQYKLGVCYGNGVGCEKDLNKSVDLITKSAKQGYGYAQLELGQYFEFGKGVEKDFTQATEWYNKAAEQGLAEAQYYLALCYEQNKNHNENSTKIIELYTKAAEQGHIKAQHKLGLIFEKYSRTYFAGDPTPKKSQRHYFEKAEYWLKKAVEQGCSESQFMLGKMYYFKHIMKKDSQSPYNCFLKASEQGHKEAQYYVGCCFEKGYGVEKDFNKAVEWYLKSAESGYSVAQRKIGFLYDEGKVLPKDKIKATEFLVRAAENGDAAAIYYLGNCFEFCDDIEKDAEQASFWYIKTRSLNDNELSDALIYNSEKKRKEGERAFALYSKVATQNIFTGIYNLAQCYLKGEGTNQNVKKAIELLEKAAEDGFEGAYSGLAEIYAEGKYVSRDIYKATDLYIKDKTNDEFKNECIIKMLMAGSRNAWEYAETDYEKGGDAFTETLACCYVFGLGTDKSYEKAMSIINKYRERRKRTSVSLLLLLSYCYEMGYGVNIDLVQSMKIKQDLMDNNYNIFNDKDASYWATLEEQESLADFIKKTYQGVDEIIDELKKIREELMEKNEGTQTTGLSRNEILDLIRNVEVIKEGVSSINNKLDSFILSVQTCVEQNKEQYSALYEKLASFEDNMNEQSLETDRKLSKLFQNVSEKISKMVSEGSDEETYNDCCNYLKGLYGDYWDKMHDYTKNALVSGQVLLKKTKEIKNKDFDYSGICISVCSALEKQFQVLVFNNLQNYLINVKKMSFEELPKQLKYEGKLDDGRSLSIGAFPFYLGINPNEKYSKDEQEELEKLLTEYIRTSTQNASFSIKDKLTPIIQKTEKIRKDFRNPAAHTKNISYKKAYQCTKYVVGRKDASEHMGAVQGVLLELMILLSPKD